MSAKWGLGIVRAAEWSDVARRNFEELCKLASAAAGVELVSAPVESYRELIWGLEENEVGLAWLPPISTIEAEERNVGTPIAIPTRRGSSSYHSALVVRRGGPKSVAELEGRRVAWVDRDSAAGYLLPRLSLAAEGFDVLRFFAREIFVHSHARVVEAVANGDADVGATYCHLGANGEIASGAWNENARASHSLEPLTTFGPIPNDALVVAAALPAAARSALARWVLTLDDRARALFDTLLGASDFRVPAPDHFDALKHSLRAARARGHTAMPRESRRGLRIARKSSE